MIPLLLLNVLRIKISSIYFYFKYFSEILAYIIKNTQVHNQVHRQVFLEVFGPVFSTFSNKGILIHFLTKTKIMIFNNQRTFMNKVDKIRSNVNL